MSDTEVSPGVAATAAWVEEFVVGLNVCPFAGREVTRGSIRYIEVDGRRLEDALVALLEACHHLETTPEVETSLLVFTRGLADFDDYLDALAMAEALLADRGYEGVFQLASFHPDYVFDGVDDDDPANFTNRSPWPVWHLLREEGLERALAHYPDPEAIPERNIERLREIGSDSLAERLAELKARFR
ncbi:DUF1415 domain-containing protein [Halomonas sp. H33-56]|uniref:DUF1415 domain-containing protein n=1 Tax=unclassified Halomonas TaxID=2609666 RepID=UPI000F5D767F|nr:MULTISPECIES: DUF1415 domain-containing protein [unclassified Halomonas]MBY5941670.1 DUF1415 domain-containing protein [Halomonas sp. DP5N14-9]RQW72626.1 DUF1415 domain-containing protein [Halomonas sp. YLB-10]